MKWSTIKGRWSVVNDQWRIFGRVGVSVMLVLLGSCSLETPEAPQADNPWDPGNPNPPRAPINFTGTVLSETSVELRWEDRSGNESGFWIHRLEPDTLIDSVRISPPDTVPANVNSVRLEGLRKATSYEFSIFAYNHSGLSEPVEPVLLNTGQIVPTAPSDLVAEVLDGVRIRLTWADHSANEDGFEIYRSTDSVRFELAFTSPADSFHWTSDSLDPFTRSIFRIRAVNSFGVTPFIYSTSLFPGDVTLAPPFAVTARSISETEAVIEWSDTNLTTESHGIYQSIDDTLHFTEVGFTGKQELSYQAANLLPNRRYFFRIDNSNRYGHSTPSPSVQVLTAEAEPWPPGNFRASLSGELDVNLSWRDGSSIERGFLLEESVGDSLHFVVLDTLPANTVRETIEDCTPFVVRYYRLAAMGISGNSPQVISNRITPGALSPRPPTSITGRPLGSREIALTWRDDSRIEESFKLEIRVGGGVWTHLSMEAADDTSFTAEGLTPNTQYSFQIRAENRYGASAYVRSAAVTTLGPPQPPSGVVVDGFNRDTVRINWALAPGNNDGFILEDSLDGAAGWSVTDTITDAAAREYYVESPRYIARYFRVRSYNQYGVSNYSNVDSATPFCIVAAVACSYAGVVLLDVTDPTNPALIGTADTPGQAQRVAFEAERAYVADSYSGVSVLKVNSPRSPSLLSSFQTEERAYGITVTNQIGFIADGDSGLTIVDFTNAQSPSKLSKYSLRPGLAQSLFKSGNYIFITAQSRGVVRFDVSNVRSPVLRHESSSASSSQGLCPGSNNSNVFVADFGAGFRVLRGSDLNPVGVIDFQATPTDVVSFDGNIAYTANGNRSISVINATSPQNPQVVTTIGMPDDVWGIGVTRGHLFICADSQGLIMMSLDDPLAPSRVGGYVTPGPAKGVTIREYQ
jgi:hypothetical protein